MVIQGLNKIKMSCLMIPSFQYKKQWRSKEGGGKWENAPRGEGLGSVSTHFV